MKTRIQSRIHVTPTRDFSTMHAIMRHPAVYPFMTDDTSPEPHLAYLIQAAIYLLVLDGGSPVGFFGLQPLTDNTGYIVHTVMLPGFRGGKALQAARQGMNWVFRNTSATRIESYSFDHQPEVALFCRWAGFKEYGAHIHPVTVNGSKILVHDFRITKAQWRELPCRSQQSEH